MNVKLCKKQPAKIEYFENCKIIQTANVNDIKIVRTYFWSRRYGDNLCTFTVFADCDLRNHKLLCVTQSFELQHIGRNQNTYKVLEQCIYVNYDAVLRTLQAQFDRFEISSVFSPLNEKTLKKELAAMMAYLPPEQS